MGQVIIKAEVWAEILSRVSKLASTRVKVGIIGEKAAEVYDNGMTVGEIAAIQELGNSHLPPREFIRPTFQKGESKEAITNQLVRVAKDVVERGVPADLALNHVGDVAVAAVRATILQGEGVPPPNAESTIRQKGFDHPLVATHKLADAISHEVTHEAGTSVSDAVIPSVVEEG